MTHVVDKTLSDKATEVIGESDDPALGIPGQDTSFYPSLPPVGAGRLHFAPGGEAAPTAPVPNLRTATAQRSARCERFFEAGWMLLILACAAEGVFRLLWAAQPLP